MKHDQLLDCLEHRVRLAHKGALIQRELEYGITPDHKYPIGEIDLLRYSNRRLVMYEVKGCDSPCGVRKAKEQFRRFKRYIAPMKVVGVYVAEGKVKRMY